MPSSVQCSSAVATVSDQLWFALIDCNVAFALASIWPIVCELSKLWTSSSTQVRATGPINRTSFNNKRDDTCHHSFVFLCSAACATNLTDNIEIIKLTFSLHCLCMIEWSWRAIAGPMTLDANVSNTPQKADSFAGPRDSAHRTVNVGLSE